MLISGLWKLAAMTGVIGVGLVAVYQAKQGIDNSSGTAAVQTEAGVDTEEAPPEVDPDELVAANAAQDSDSESGGTEPLGGPDARSAFKPLETTEAQSSQTSIGRTPTLLPPDESPAVPSRGRAAILPEQAEALEQQLLGGGDPASQPQLKPAGESATQLPVRPVRTAAGQKSAGTLDVPEAEAETPFVQQTGASEEPAPAANDQADPFGDAEPFPESPGKRPAAVPETLEDPVSTPPAKSGESDPLDPLDSAFSESKGPAGTEDLSADPAEQPRREPAQESADPFGGAEPVERPATLNPKSRPAIPTEDLDSPFSQEPPAQERPATDGFPSDEAPARELPGRELPGRSLPGAPPAATPDDTGLDDFPKAAPRSLPALPTEIPESPASNQPPASQELPGEPEQESFPAAPPRSLTPQPETRPTPGREAEPAKRTPKPVQDDLIGDGVISDTSPRGVQTSRVTIEKIAPQQAALGEPLVYSIIIKNIGGTDALNVLVEDRIPKGTELSGTAPRAELLDRKLMWRIGTLKANEERKISIRVIPRQQGQVGSVASVSYSTEVAAETAVAAPQLTMTAKAPRQVRVGETFDLMFLLKNTGSVVASNVSVRDLVPAGLKHEAASDIECPIGRLAPNESREVVLTVTAIKPGRVMNRAILTGEGGILQEIESPIDVVGEQLVLTRSGQTKVYVDRPAQFANNVRNDGDDEVQNIRISEVIPAGMEFVEASDGGRFDPVQRAIVWDIGALPSGAEATVSSRLVGRAPGVQQARVTATGPSGSTAQVKSDVDVVGRPELQIETVGRTGSVVVGDRLTSRIQLKNHGSASARNVAMKIHLPRELRLVEVRGAKYTVQQNDVVFEPVAAISPRETVAYELVMEAVAQADVLVDLEITADHLTKPAKRTDTIQIASENR